MGIENRMRGQEDDRKSKQKSKQTAADDSEISLHVAVHAVPTQTRFTSAIAATAAAPRFISAAVVSG